LSLALFDCAFSRCNFVSHDLQFADLAEIAKFLGITTTVDTEAIQVSYFDFLAYHFTEFVAIRSVKDKLLGAYGLLKFHFFCFMSLFSFSIGLIFYFC